MAKVTEKVLTGISLPSLRKDEDPRQRWVDHFVREAFKLRLSARDGNQMADFVCDLLGRRHGLGNFLT